MLIRTTMVVCAALLLSVDGLDAQRTTRRTWVIPHVLEKEGLAANSTDTWDTELHMVNLDRRATVEVSVFDNDGQPARARNGQAVCAPCTFTFSRGPKQVFSLRERIGAAGGSAREMMSGYVVITAAGPGEVNLQGFVVNAHTRSLSGFQPQEVKGTATP